MRHRLAGAPAGLVVVTAVRAAVQRVSGSATDPVVVRAGEEVPFERLVAELDDIGYARTDRVESRGELAVRGGVIDVFPAQADDAVRIDFWGDYVEELRVFSIGSQRSMGAVDEMAAYPAREFRPVRR